MTSCRGCFLYFLGPLLQNKIYILFLFCVVILQMNNLGKGGGKGGMCGLGGKAGAVAIDKFSRKVFPAIFVIFNIVYWIMYTLPDDTDKPH